jgi:DNA-binding CsgD family transcriptional regulator
VTINHRSNLASMALPPALVPLGKPRSTELSAVPLLRRALTSPPPQRSQAPAVTVRRAEGRPLIFYAHRCLIGAILIIVDPGICREPAGLLLREMFGLTSAETRIATGLLRGLELRDIAAAHKVSEGTVRTQLKSVLSKTGTHRQVELVTLLTSLARVPLSTAEVPREG